MPFSGSITERQFVHWLFYIDYNGACMKINVCEIDYYLQCGGVPSEYIREG